MTPVSGRSPSTRMLMVPLVMTGMICAGLAACATQPPADDAADVTRSIGDATFGLEAYFEAGSIGSQQVSLTSAALAAQPIDQAAVEGSFPPASVQARVRVLVLLNAYVTKLAALADTDSPLEDLETAKTLDPEIAGLPKAIAALHDPTGARYGAPVAAVLAWVGQDFTADQRGPAMQQALQTAAPAASQLLDLLAADVKSIQDQRVTGSAELMERERAYYNSNLRRLSLADRVALVQAMQATSVAHEAAQTHAAEGLIGAVQKMHTALVAYVSSPRSSADQQTVAAAMMQFSETVTPLSKALMGG